MQKENLLKSCCKKILSSREVVARDLPHLMPLLLLNRKQQPYSIREVEDPGTLRAATLAGMTPLFYNGNKGFTLIELLVVVLIIGILAAVALPQYQKAVEKSRMVQEITATRSLYNALEVYRLANGEYPPLPASDQHYNIDVSYFNDLLDIDLPDIGTLAYYRDMFISFSGSPIGANWAVGGGYGNGKIICSSHPTYSTYEKYKNLCLTLCTDKQWRTWEHGEYCIL